MEMRNTKICQVTAAHQGGRVASMDASRSIGQLTSMIETANHTVDKLVSDERAPGAEGPPGF
eukprot:11692012-Prorocentrum_lima.AAC.1